MEHYIGPKALLWQKLAVKVKRDVIMGDILLGALRCGATFLHIECGLYTSRELTVLLDRCNAIIQRYAEECLPWPVSIGIICELSGPRARVQFAPDGSDLVQALEQQRITLTGDGSFENQCFDEVKYVTNFDQLQQRSCVGDVLSIGPVKLTVERIVHGYITCRVTRAGFIERFSVVKIDREENSTTEQRDFEMSSTLEEAERVMGNGCKFIIVPQMSAKSLHLFVGSLKALEQIQVIAHASNTYADPNSHQSIDAFVTKDVVLLQQTKSIGKAVLCNLKDEQISETIVQADVIIATAGELTRIQDYLIHANGTQLEAQLSNRLLDPDEESMATCLNCCAQQFRTSAIILPWGKNNIELALELYLKNPLCVVLILHPSAADVNRILLRKHLVPIIVPKLAAVTSSTQKRIHRAIAYGRRFGYLHDGSCIVAGRIGHVGGSSEPTLEVRYVPLECAHKELEQESD
ncbi:uncharacterized protein LOC118506740 [Anopheles stephensi]|uniref:uncharacterized protein LOC118506740 n=1 Tax=Anopheles stephensi TaxID=30069 RepID=UPI00165882FA|nr:uncharacterized protein LOC118506740 [Anopheles stephensi]